MATLRQRASEEIRYEKLTWPEIEEAVELGKVCILPCGAVEQHGPHLPLDVDMVCSCEVALGAARLVPDQALVLPVYSYGYTGHVVDFPGTINGHYQHFISSVLDVAKSLAYHGFKKIVLLNGHGSNMPNLDLVSRRANLETDAECVLAAWWAMLSIDPEFLPRWRESKFPGGISHAGELETSLYLYLDGDNVRQDRIKSGQASFNAEYDPEKAPFRYADLFGHGPFDLNSWTSSYSETGVFGDAEKGSAEKGEAAYKEATTQLARFISYFKTRPKEPRRQKHRRPPTMPTPWGQSDDWE